MSIYESVMRQILTKLSVSKEWVYDEITDYLIASIKTRNGCMKSQMITDLVNSNYFRNNPAPKREEGGLVVTLAFVDDALRMLEEEGLVTFEKGQYRLTEKGEEKNRK